MTFQAYTIADFREHIANMLKVTPEDVAGQPPRFPNSAHPSLVRKPGQPKYDPPQHPTNRKK